METIPIGYISIFVNLPRQHDYSISDVEVLSIEKTVVAEFEQRLWKSELRETVVVNESFSRRGCIVITITLGVIAAGVASFVKNYPKYREGIIAIAKDIPSISMYIKGNTYRKSVFLNDESIKPIDNNDLEDKSVMQDSPDNQTIVKYLLRGATPERADDITRNWNKYNPIIEVAESNKGVTMNANSERIRFNTKTVDIFWLIGFSAWRSIATYSPAIVLALITQVSLDDALGVDEELPSIERDYKDRMAAAQSIISGSRENFGHWPPDIPKPQADRNLLTLQDKVAFDLVCLALAFAFSHEFRHVMLLTEGRQHAVLAEEEIACDVWARGFLTEKLATYAEKHGHDYKNVLNKRSMGMALGAIIVHAITPSYAHWGNSEYPPIADRIEALVGGTNLPDDSHFWMFTACLLVGIIRQSHRPLDIVPGSPRQLVGELIMRLR